MRIAMIEGFLAGAGCTMLLAATPVLPQRHSNPPRRLRTTSPSDPYELLQAEEEEISRKQNSRPSTSSALPSFSSDPPSLGIVGSSPEATREETLQRQLSTSSLSTFTSKSKPGKSTSSLSTSKSKARKSTSSLSISTSKSKARKFTSSLSTSTSKSKAGKSTSSLSTSKSKAGKSTSSLSISTSKSKAGKSTSSLSISTSNIKARKFTSSLSISTSKSKAGKSTSSLSTSKSKAGKSTSSLSISSTSTSKSKAGKPTSGLSISTSKSKAGKSTSSFSISTSKSKARKFTSSLSISTFKSKAGNFSTSKSKASKSTSSLSISTSKSKAGKSTSSLSISTSKSKASKSTSSFSITTSKSKAGKSSTNKSSRKRRCSKSTSLPWESKSKRRLSGKSKGEKSQKDPCRDSSVAPSLSSVPTARPSRAPSITIEVSLSIVPEDPDVIDGGVPGRLYFFDLLAENVPAGLGTVRFEWSGLGTVNQRTANVASDGRATTRVELSNTVPGPYTVDAKVFDGQAELAAAELDVRIAGTALAIDPPGLTDGETNTLYSFDFVATDVPAGIGSVTINWSFGTGSSGVGQASVPVTNGRATVSATQTYSGEGSFQLTASVKDGGLVLADNSVTVTIGDVTSRTFTLGSCGDFIPSNAGGAGTTVDLWDASVIPPDATFDIRFQAFQIPDRFIVEYPFGNEVLDTGWRGSFSNNGNPLYPGGVVGPGSGFVNNMFTRLTASEFQVTIFGPDAGTAWNYEIRCRLAQTTDLDPIQTESLVQEISQEEVEASIKEENSLAAALKENDKDNTPALEEGAIGEDFKVYCPWC